MPQVLATAILCLFVSVSALGDDKPAPRLRVTTIPPRVLVDRCEFDQRLNFDLLVENPSAVALELTSLEMSAYDGSGALVSQRRVGRNGGIDSIANRSVDPGGRLVIFNPFHTFAPDLELAKIRVDLTFTAGDEAPDVTASLTIEPKIFEPKTDLTFPVGGRVLCWDGPDLYGHHRRIDITGAMTTALGITANFLRYAYDFSVVDAKGRMFKGSGERNEDWYGFGTPIYATGDGVVALAGDGVPDNTTTTRHDPTREQSMKDPHVLFGNYVVVDHGNGEVSFFAHLKQGSVVVKPGDRVRRGQPIGQMGFSGDAITVHLHYQLQSDTKWGEGLPAHFRGIRRFVGGRALPVQSGSVDSGDVVESTVAPRRGT